MATQSIRTDKRTADPYLDRRTGEDRRYKHMIGFFAQGGTESRNSQDRRMAIERRKDCIRVTKWSSVCVGARSNSKEATET